MGRLIEKIQLSDQSVLFQLVHYIYSHHCKIGDTSIRGWTSAQAAGGQ